MLKRLFEKREALKILPTNSSEEVFQISKALDGQRLATQLLLAVKLTGRKAEILKQNNKHEKEILPFVAQYQPLVSLIKEALMKKWKLLQNQPLPCQHFKEPPKVLFL